ncbi:MAG: GAF domain-containing protein [Desulfosarcina sp.]|nr:GAF domain-containing protein [Desulfobacterales bacterium]
MPTEDKINIDILKVVTRAIAGSCNLEIMAKRLAQLLVGALEIKGATLFATNIVSKELEVLGSFGLSISYMNKGPVFLDRSICAARKKEAVVVRDVSRSKVLQYPEDAAKEGIGAIVGVPIFFSGKVIGALRLYHYEVWNISEQDLDSLYVLTDIIGLAMMYARMYNAVSDVKAIVGDIHEAWMG